MPSRHKLLLTTIVFLGVILRLIWWSNVAVVLENEGVEYARLAENLFSGEGYKGIFGGTHVFFPPLYPILIGLISYISGDFEISARVVSLIAGTGLIPLAWCAGRALVNSRTGLICALLFACHPTFIALSVSTYSEGPFIFFSFAAVLLCLGGISRESLWLMIAAGLTWAMAYLVRPEGLVFGIVFVAMSALALFFVAKRRLKGVSFLLAGGVAFSVLAAPYVLDLSQKAGSFQWEGKSGVTTIIGERIDQGMSYTEAVRGLSGNESTDGPFLRIEDQTWMLRHSSAGASSVLTDLISDPFGKIRSILARMFFATYLASPFIFAFSIVGLVATGWWRRNPISGLFFVMYGALALLLAISTKIQFARYMIPILPAAAIWAAAGIDFTASKMSAYLQGRFEYPPRQTGILLSAIFCLGLFFVALRPTYRLGEFSQASRVSARDIGVTIGSDFQENSASNFRRPVIAGFGLAPAYYAGGVLRYLAFAPGDEGIQYLRDMSPDYVVLQDIEKVQAPYVAAWLEEGIPDSCAREIASNANGSSQFEYRVWTWNCQQDSFND